MKRDSPYYKPKADDSDKVSHPANTNSSFDFRTTEEERLLSKARSFLLTPDDLTRIEISYPSLIRDPFVQSQRAQWRINHGLSA
jgi:hypothetical protein